MIPIRADMGELLLVGGAVQLVLFSWCCSVGAVQLML
jgi:hypothetical protein